MTAESDLPINDAVPAPTKIEPGNLFLWNWRQMQVYAQACVAHATAAKDAEIEALRAERDLFRDETIELVRQNGEWQARAERLAEALRDAADDIDAGVPPEDAAAHLRARADLLRDQGAG